MKDPLEEKLHDLRPAAPSAELMARLRAARSEVRQESAVILHFRRALPWLATGAAAAALVVAVLHQTRSGGETVAADPMSLPAAGEEIYESLGTERYVIQAGQSAIIVPPDGPPVKLIRCAILDDETYRRQNDPRPALKVQGMRQGWMPVALRVD